MNNASETNSEPNQHPDSRDSFCMVGQLMHAEWPQEQTLHDEKWSISHIEVARTLFPARSWVEMGRLEVDVVQPSSFPYGLTLRSDIETGDMRRLSRS